MEVPTGAHNTDICVHAGVDGGKDGAWVRTVDHLTGHRWLQHKLAPAAAASAACATSVGHHIRGHADAGEVFEVPGRLSAKHNLVERGEKESNSGRRDIERRSSVERNGDRRKKGQRRKEGGEGDLLT